MREHEVFWRLAEAGYTKHMESWSVDGHALIGRATPAFLLKLRNDKRFASGIFYGLHRDVGDCLEDFRSYHGALGPGSVQVVIDKKTYAVYCDIDRNNPYQDVVRFVGHSGDVIGHFFRKLFRRRRHETVVAKSNDSR